MSTLPRSYSSFGSEFCPYLYLATSYDGYILGFIVFCHDILPEIAVRFPAPVRSRTIPTWYPCQWGPDKQVVFRAMSGFVCYLKC